ncbi:MAG: response regulator [bacterium]|nr:response regulator [bacterium]
MKISFRILLINFLIVALILGSSFIVFYSIIYDVLTNYQTRNLRQSASSLVNVNKQLQDGIEDDFISLYTKGIDAVWSGQNFQSRNLDFVIELKNDLVTRYVVKNNIYLPQKELSRRDFTNSNPYILLMSYTSPDGKEYLYGRAINNEMVDDIAQRVNSEIALVWDGFVADFSNQQMNQKYLHVLNLAAEDLKSKSNFDLYMQGTESEDILATVYKPTIEGNESNFSYLIFSTFADAGELRSTLRNIFIIIGLVGISLSLIFTMVFTDKMRKQFTALSKATEQTYSGKFDNKIEIKSKDEIGKLGMAFNKMLDELKKKEVARNEYAEFITLINQNPTLKEISDEALKKILDAGDFIIGGLYSVDEEIKLISAYGLNAEFTERPENSAFFKKVLETKQSMELLDEETLPVVSAGLVEIKLKYLLFLPIVYNNKPVALLELGSLTKPREEVRDYLEKIKDQLAIGITNARALLQLEKLVNELKTLNEEYQKQNNQIKEQNETLLYLHSELTAQAEELEKQRQKAIELTDAKSKFLANMSHELRTPMNSILGLTELMLEKVDLEPRNKERLEVVLSSGKRLMMLINDILDLSKIEAGKIDLNLEDVLLDEILTEVSVAVAPLAAEKNITFDVIRNIDTHTVISTDRGKVVQVLMNLLGNAVKYTDQGQITLRVSIGNQMINFEVIDTGIGIPKDDIDLIFEEFQRVNNSKARKRGGTGLGLAISKKLADVLSGSLTVKSEINKGSTFTFSIPFNQVVLHIDKKHYRPTNVFVNAKEKNFILVIDQEKRLRASVKQDLLTIGYELEFAEEEAGALSFESNRIPLAIMVDATLSCNDVWNTLIALKKNIHTNNIPVILVSTMLEANLGYCFDAFDYVLKPVTIEALSQPISRLTNLLKKKINKIIVVDDNEEEFNSYANSVRKEDMRIELLKPNENVISRIVETQPDVVIINLTNSGKDTIKLTHQLKSTSVSGHIPVIIGLDNKITEDQKRLLNESLEQIILKSEYHPIDAFHSVSNWIEIQRLASAAYESVSDIRDGSNDKQKLIREPSENQQADLNILIVDDDSNTLFTLAEIVRSANCKPILANNGKECLEILEDKIPDLIFLDIIMPEMDGFKTIKQIKKNEKWSDIPVFAVTAKAMKEDNEIIIRHGFSDYIPKPVNPALVTHKIQTVIAQLKTT